MQYQQDDSAGNGQINPALSVYVCLGNPCSYRTVTYVTVVTEQLHMLL